MTKMNDIYKHTPVDPEHLNVRAAVSENKTSQLEINRLKEQVQFLQTELIKTQRSLKRLNNNVDNRINRLEQRTNKLR